MEALNSEPLVLDLEYPPLLDRVQSTIFDTLFLVLLTFIFGALLDQYSDAPDWIRVVLFFGLWAVYEPVATSLGGTIGNYVKGIRVRKYKNPDKKVNVFQALLRYIFKISLGWLSFVSIHSNRERRAIHDFVAGSVMVKRSVG